MPAKDLKTDIKANLADLVALAKAKTGEGDDATPVLQTPGEIAIVAHLQNSLWPFLDGLCDELQQHEDSWKEVGPELEEMADAIDEITEERGTVLMPEEAGVFSLLVKLVRDATAKLRKGTALTSDEIGALELACDASEKVIQENVINVDVDDDGDDDGDDDDEGDD